MVKDIDKLKIKNWVIGDTFAWKINSEEYPKYNNRYILFTVVDKPKTWDAKKTRKAMVAKLTNENLPKNQKEYEKLENIKLTFADPVELANRLYEVKYSAIPDDYDYVYGYVFEMWIPKYCFSDDMIYIGNFIFNEPSDSFLPQKQYFGLSFLLFNKDFKREVDNIISSYELINLRKDFKFSEEYLKNRDKIRQDNIDFMNYLRKVSEEIRKKCKIYGCDTKKHRDTCTYVGPKKNRK